MKSHLTVYRGYPIACFALLYAVFYSCWLHAGSLPADISYVLNDGVRVVENQSIDSTLTIDGDEWSGAIIRNNFFSGQKKMALHVSNVSDLVIEGNEFTELGGNAIKLRDYKNSWAHNVLIRDNSFHVLEKTPILVGEPNNWTQIVANRFVNVASDGTGNKQHAIYVKGADSLIEGNWIDGVVDAHGISIRSSGTVRNNIVKNVNRDGIKYYSNSSKRGSGELIIEGNLLVACGHGGIVLANGRKALIERADVRFNTLINTRRGLRIYPELDSVQLAVYGNLIVEPSGKFKAFDSGVDLLSGNLTTTGDIGFFDFTAGDYRLRADSVANGYVEKVPSLPPYDLLRHRFAAPPWAAGAYQPE